MDINKLRRDTKRGEELAREAAAKANRDRLAMEAKAKRDERDRVDGEEWPKFEKRIKLAAKTGSGSVSECYYDQDLPCALAQKAKEEGLTAEVTLSEGMPGDGAPDLWHLRISWA